MAAFSRACGATAEEEREALKLWQAARAEDRGILATLRAPSVTNIRTAQDLTTALAATYERAGAPALRLVQERATTDQADGALLLPLTTLWRITRREGSGPATWEQCEAYLRGCGVHSVRMRLWREAFTRARTPVAADPGDLGELTRANLGRLSGGGPGAAKISKRFRALLNRMTSQEVETALTVGTAYLATEGARSYTATPTTFDHIFRVGRELFLPGAPGEPGTGQGDAVAPFRRAKAATPAPDGLSRADRPSTLPVVVTHVLGAEARRNGTAPTPSASATAPSASSSSSATPPPSHPHPAARPPGRAFPAPAAPPARLAAPGSPHPRLHDLRQRPHTAPSPHHSAGQQRRTRPRRRLRTAAAVRTRPARPRQRAGRCRPKASHRATVRCWRGGCDRQAVHAVLVAVEVFGPAGDEEILHGTPASAEPRVKPSSRLKGRAVLAAFHNGQGIEAGRVRREGAAQTPAALRAGCRCRRRVELAPRVSQWVGPRRSVGTAVLGRASSLPPLLA
ncbi:hypothetical protein ACFVZC_32925 [Streptomyces marokkonensis]|uniref:Integrase n=1 Tax=Streptomyces marokkonensis TaxID=324855 RepID=A0ABW6QHC9_9ACTN